MDIVGAYGARYSGKYKMPWQPTTGIQKAHASAVEDTAPVRSPTCKSQMARSARYSPNLDTR